ncbi:MAG: ABC transporter permease [Anaerolineales bacterium]|jgi:ABC-type multidrug transport system permease subunit
MDTSTHSGLTAWRIISSIYIKDLLETIRNWATLTVILGTAMVIITAQAGKLLADLVDQKTIYVYAPKRSTLLRAMRQIDDLSVVPVNSLETMQVAVGDAPDVRIGVIISTEAEAGFEAGQRINLDVLTAHWAEPDDVDRLIKNLDQQLSTTTEVEIRYEILEEEAYPQLERGSRSIMVTSALVIGVLTIGTFITPYLMAEEREEGTLTVLRLSPASGSQIVFAKALVGLTYCLVVGSVALAFNWHFVVHAWLALSALLLLGLFAVCLGLFVGLIAEQMSTINLWMAVALLILILPTIFLFMEAGSLPGWLVAFMEWVPTVAAGKLMRISFLNNIDPGILLQPTLALMLLVLISFSAVVWQLKQEDRV